MIMEKIGRNDPCPCGSGRKYKRCCMDKGIGGPPREVTARAEQPAGSCSPPTESVLRDIERMMSRLPPGKRAACEAAVRDLRAHLAWNDSVEQASRALDPYRRDFEALAKDSRKFLEHSRRLFQEESFSRFRFGLDDVRRAFQKVGYPPTVVLNDETYEVVKKAILFLADKDYRERASRELLGLLPALVRDGRHLEGLMAEHCAFMTSEEPEESNAFLFEMFLHGYGEWEEQREREDVDMLKAFGLSPEEVRRLGVEGISERVDELMRDPAKKALFDRLTESNPERYAAMTANCRASENASAAILKGKDRDRFLLSMEEMGPWLEEFGHRLAASPECSAAAQSGRPPAGIEKILGQIMADLADDMEEKIFTPGRIRQLKEDLMDYHRSLSAREDKAGLAAVHGALLSIGREGAVHQSRFLATLCFESLREGMRRVAEAGAPE